MMLQGVWFLMVMVYGSHGNLVLIPYEKYDSYQLCNMWMGRESLELGVTMTCVQQHDGDI